MNQIKFLVSVVGLLISSALWACLPPPPNYHEASSISEIVNSREVIEILGDNSILAIRTLPQGKFAVETKRCVLNVTVEVERKNPDAPCGGPLTFTAVPDGALVCLDKKS